MQRLRNELDAVFARADVPELDLETRSDLARYACVRLTGYLEQSLLNCGLSLIGNQAGGAARRFGESYLAKSFNPTQGEIADFVGRFDLLWKEALEIWLAEFERGQTINAIVGIRNQIAHGGSQTISIERLKQYRFVVEDLLAWLLDRFDPLPARAASREA